MKKATSRSGSALLIVLGMLSFLIVSAVGFSAYMRFARLPSSYLRRTSSTRLLAKAAMAEAVNALDLAVCNNPHPGLGCEYVEERENGWLLLMDPNRDNPVRSRNIWQHRVLVGTNDQRYVGKNITVSPDIVKSGTPSYDTVSPLCLEALAYIPAPLVNEARAYSRVVPSASWQNLDFDSGRYCYTVLDVSDYFDVNRLTADRPRSSASGGRISLAHLFENARHETAGTGAAQWDTFMKKFREFDEDTLSVDFAGKNPLISIADLNLALGRNGAIGQLKSPFWNYIQNGTGSGGFYQTTSTTEEDALRRLTFVTDGLFPEDSKDYDDQGVDGKGSEVYELGEASHQPFPEALLATKGGRKPNLSNAFMGNGMNDGARWIEHLGLVGCAALFDYLDTDHVPCSLALPVTERVPMICGVSPKFEGAKFVVKKTDPDVSEYKIVSGLEGTDPNMLPLGTVQEVEATVLYSVGAELAKGFMAGEVKALALYPFAHDDKESDGSFNIDGRFSLFLSTDRMPFRTGGDPKNVLPLDSPNIPEPGDDKEFTVKGLLSAKLQPQAIGDISNIRSMDDAIKEVDGLRMGNAGPAHATRLQQKGNELLRMTYKWKRTVIVPEGDKFGQRTWDYETLESAQAAGQFDNGKNITKSSAFQMLDASGKASQDFLKDIDITTFDSGPTVRLNAAVWLRVLDGKDTVDMVPASVFDDKVQNNVPDAQMMAPLASRLGQASPILRFDTGVEFEMSIKNLDSLSQEIKISPEAIVCADPRFNHAPESWSKAAAHSKQEFLKSADLGNGGRDRDFFLATSDAGYLQSKWELAQLQRFGDLDTYGADKTLCNLEAPAATQYEYANDASGALNRKAMWRTYDPFDADEEAFAKLPWKSEGTGQKVNPYSDSESVLMAAFANTPIDWRCTSTNNLPGSTDYASMPSSQFNKQYAFNAYANEYKIKWDTLEKIAQNFRDEVRRKVRDGDAGGVRHWVQKHENHDPQYTPWEEAWQTLDWYGDDDTFCGVELDANDTDLWMTDRKFLYGYWRDCFAPKQQLYLVFVRAEPVMMGGDIAGQVPPQLGARAMAVVWRDPYRTRQDGDIYRPHQTRVLFYRQFD